MAVATEWAGAAIVRTPASLSQGIKTFTFREKAKLLSRVFPDGRLWHTRPHPSFLPSDLLVCQGYGVSTHPPRVDNHVPEPKPAAKKDPVHRTFTGGGGGSFSSSLPFHICSLTSRAPSWERTECLSRGGGTGSRQSQEAQLWGWLAARSMASFSPAPHCCKEQGLSPPGNQ